MAERTIVAYFKTPGEAEQAVDRMQSLRLTNHSIERNGGGYPDGGAPQAGNLEFSLFAGFPGASYLALGSNFIPSAGMLSAANISAGGYSSDGYTNGRDLVLTATVDEEDYEQALQIVEESGGSR